MSAPRFRGKSSSGCVKKNNCNITKDIYRMTAGERIKRNMSAEYCEGVCENISMLKKIQSNFEKIYQNAIDTGAPDSIMIVINSLREEMNAHVKNKFMEKAMDVLSELIEIRVNA